MRKILSLAVFLYNFLTVFGLGGSVANINDFPYQASVFENGGFSCNGVIINNRHVLSLQVCARNDPSKYWIGYGSPDISNGPGPYKVSVEKIIVHPNSSANSLDYNIALFKTSTLIDFTFAKPIVLIRREVKYVTGLNITVTGWSKLSNRDPNFNPRLEKIVVPITDYKKCIQLHNITPRMFCAGFVAGGPDFCDGGNGSPAVIYNTNKKYYVLVGIVRWPMCGAPNSPSMYMDIGTMHRWIRVESKCNCGSKQCRKKNSINF